MQCQQNAQLWVYLQVIHGGRNQGSPGLLICLRLFLLSTAFDLSLYVSCPPVQGRRSKHVMVDRIAFIGWINRLA
jgi:hypothetical protein